MLHSDVPGHHFMPLAVDTPPPISRAAGPALPLTPAPAADPCALNNNPLSWETSVVSRVRG